MLPCLTTRRRLISDFCSALFRSFKGINRSNVTPWLLEHWTRWGFGEGAGGYVVFGWGTASFFFFFAMLAVSPAAERLGRLQKEKPEIWDFKSTGHFVKKQKKQTSAFFVSIHTGNQPLYLLNVCLIPTTGMEDILGWDLHISFRGWCHTTVHFISVILLHHRRLQYVNEPLNSVP